MIKVSRSILILLFLVPVSAGTALADTVMFSGTTVGGPTWHRPFPGIPPTTITGLGTNVPYSVTQITVGISGAYDFLCLGVTPTNWDNFVVVYQNSFNPASPLTNAIAANDDFPSIGRSGFTALNLTAGTTYFYVVTGFSNTSAGAWETTIMGPGTITVGGGPNNVPEPTTMLLLGSGLMGIGLKLRKRRKE